MRGSRQPSRLNRLSRLFATLSLATALGSCGAPIGRPTEGPCAAADPRVQAEKARASLVFRGFRARPMYDVDFDGRPVPFLPRAAPADSQAVVSYPDPQRHPGGEGLEHLSGRSFVYDDALAALMLTAEGDRAGARRILQTLAALQRPDGAWGFSFEIQGDGFYNFQYVRSGAVAWCVYAFARYVERFGDPHMLLPAIRGGEWLLRQRDPQTGLVRGGFGRWLDAQRFDPQFVADWASTEHQVDTWFALHALAAADPSGRWAILAGVDTVGSAVEANLFMHRQERYAQGRQLGGTSVTGHDPESALDAAGVWTALYAVAQRRPHDADSLLEWVDRHHRFDLDGWTAWRPYIESPPETWFVEGSLAIGLVHHRLGRNDEARAFLGQFAQLSCLEEGPLVYSPRWHADFPLTPAAAPTLWFVMVTREIYGGERFLWGEIAGGVQRGPISPSTDSPQPPA